MDQLLVVLLIVVCVLYTSISYATSVEVTTDGIIQMSIFLAGAAVFFLILRRVHWLYLNGRPVETLPTWLCNGRFASLSMYFQDSMEDLHRSVRRKGTYAHVALQAAEQFSEVHERRWAMDPAIVMLVVAQLLVATIIAYGTAVEVTLDGYAGFLFCSAFGAFVIVLAKRSGWTLYSGRWKSDFLGVEKMLPEGLSGLLAYYIRLALTVMLPVQLLLFPAVWFAAQWELLDPWLIEALRREEAWAMWALAAILVVTTYIPLYRKHGPGVFLLSMVALGAIVVVIFGFVWSVDHPFGGVAVVGICALLCALSNVDLGIFGLGRCDSCGTKFKPLLIGGNGHRGGADLSKENLHPSPRPPSSSSAAVDNYPWPTGGAGFAEHGGSGAMQQRQPSTRPEWFGL